MVDRVAFRSALLDLLDLHVRGNRDVSYASRSQRGPDCQIGYALDVGAVLDSIVINSDVDEELVQRHVLLRKGADQIAVLESGDRQNGGMIHLRVIKSVEKMNASRPGSCDTHTKPAGELGIGACHESRSLFVPDVNEADPVFLFAESFEDSIDAITRQSKHGVNAPRKEPLDKYVRRIDHLYLRKAVSSFGSGQRLGRAFA